jgi:hypothetical protein
MEEEKETIYGTAVRFTNSRIAYDQVLGDIVF